jgi:CDP-6-deoxy-D-xylo-4-hexulose-3-dehydrase
MISLRAHGWTRGLPETNFICNKTGNLFEDSFKFVLPGYNLRSNDIFAAIAIEQLNKLPLLIDQRRKNAKYFNIKAKEYNLKTQAESENGKSSWFGFSMLLENRNLVADILHKNEIECRPIVAGNFTKNPVIKHLNCEFTEDQNARFVDKHGLFVGNSHCNLFREIDYLFDTIKDACRD